MNFKMIHYSVLKFQQEKKMSNSWCSFWHSRPDWAGYKATSIGVMCGIGKALADNYWLFTNIPMSGNDHSEAASKFFYGLIQALLMTVILGGAGLALDYLRTQYAQQRHPAPAEDTALSARMI